MKKIFTIIGLSSLLTSPLFAQTTATDFTADDCNGVSHNLFTELDAGKIIVIAWVMPCGGCIQPAKTAYNAVQTFASSNPGQVLFYLVDDYANTSCSTLGSWGNTNSMPNAVKFSNSSISMNDYGTPGMPKVVVLGCDAHTIEYNVNSTVNSQEVTTAINNMLACASSANTNELNKTTPMEVTIIPNPSSENPEIRYSITKSTPVKIEVYSVSGALIYSAEETQKEGEHSHKLTQAVKLAPGTYYAKITTDSQSTSVNFVIEK